MSVCKVLRFSFLYRKTINEESIENEINRYLAVGYSVKAMSTIGEYDLYVILER